MKRFRSCLFTLLVVGLAVWATPVGASGLSQGGDREQIIHEVRVGENLFRISLHYGTTIDAIMAANGLADPRALRVGQRLVIPDPSGDAFVVTESSSYATTYTIQPGDTLFSIARRHGITVTDLTQANNLSSAYPIRVGQQLIIPGARQTASPSTVATPDTYVVQSGDTLAAIADRFGVRLPVLAQLNGVANPSTLFPGQTLRLTDTVPPVAPGGGKRIVVDLSEQHLYAYEGERLVYSFVASSGAAPSYTRVGEFRVQSKIPNAYGSTWNIWMPHWLGIYWAGSTENGIHALPILANGQILWAGYLGRPVSYGCIVLGTHEAELLYNWAEMGTPVSIQY
jgi:LysM repeat protein